jgi:exosortase/archaeosortase family protein
MTSDRGITLSEISARIAIPSTEAAAPIGRRELLLWTVVCLFANQALLLLDVGSFDAFAASLLTQNNIFWLACGVAVYRLSLSDATVRASRLDHALALALGVLLLLSSFLPYRFGIGLLTTAVALFLVVFDRSERNLKAAGAVLLALSMQLVWGPIFFQLFTPELLTADSALVGSILAVLRPDIVQSGTTFSGPGGHALSLIAGCSSFNNVSTAVLACAAVTMLRRTDWVRGDIATVAIAASAMILINALRICLLAWGPDYHAYWHDGAGAQILAIAETLVILAIAWRGSAPPRQAS